MNKRQAKKAFKKKYGFNPTKKNVNAICRETSTLNSLVKNAVDKIVYTIKNCVEIVKNMPEDEFNEIIAKNDFDLQQIAMLKLLRSKQKRKMEV